MIPLPIRGLFVLVFQQVDDLTDHDQNGPQTHRLISSPY